MPNNQKETGADMQDKPTRNEQTSASNYLTLMQLRGIMSGIAKSSEMTKQAPGQSHRKHISQMDAAKMFATEELAEEWFIQKRWKGDVRCPKCHSDNIRRNDKVRMSMRFFCRPCRRYFSVKSGSILHDSKLPLSKWGLLLYNMSTNLKGVSALKTHNDLDIAYKSAWHLLHRVRAAMDTEIPERFSGVVEIDEAHIGGRAGKMSKSRWRKLNDMGLLGGGSRHMTHVIGMRHRETGLTRTKVIPNMFKSTIQKFVMDHTTPDCVVYTDESTAYSDLPRPHATVNHKNREYVSGDVTTNSIESIWANFKRSIVGVYHCVSPKHVERYLREISGRSNIRPLDTIDQMTQMVENMEGKRLTYAELTRYTGDNRYTVIK